jgi:hypothetical protein
MHLDDGKVWWILTPRWDADGVAGILFFAAAFTQQHLDMRPAD